MNQYPDAQLIKQYLHLRTLKTQMAERHAAELKPLTDAMDVIEGVMSARLLERGAQNTKTEEGTAYRSSVTRYKVVDQEALRNAVLEDDDKWALVSLTTVKEGMDEFVKKHGALPPGTDATTIESTNFRKA